MDELEQARRNFAEAEKNLQESQEAELAARFVVQHARNEVRNTRVNLRRAERAHQQQLAGAEKKRKLEAAHELDDLADEDVATLKHLLESGTIKHEENRRWAKEKIGE